MLQRNMRYKHNKSLMLKENNNMSDTKNLKQLGSKKTTYPKKPNIKILETFENQHQDQWYVVPFECFEFSSLCPKTGQPDMATIYINYVPKEKCVESKSLKLYLFSFRNSGEFMEDITNRIMKDLRDVLDPYYIEVYADFNSRGGIYLRPYVNDFHKDLPRHGEMSRLLKAVIYDWRATKNICG